MIQNKNTAALVKIKVWRLSVDKPSTESMMIYIIGAYKRHSALIHFNTVTYRKLKGILVPVRSRYESRIVSPLWTFKNESELSSCGQTVVLQMVPFLVH